jgi:hypothetical protein
LGGGVGRVGMGLLGFCFSADLIDAIVVYCGLEDLIDAVFANLIERGDLRHWAAVLAESLNFQIPASSILFACFEIGGRFRLPCCTAFLHQNIRMIQTYDVTDEIIIMIEKADMLFTELAGT